MKYELQICPGLRGLRLNEIGGKSVKFEIILSRIYIWYDYIYSDVGGKLVSICGVAIYTSRSRCQGKKV